LLGANGFHLAVVSDLSWTLALKAVSRVESVETAQGFFPAPRTSWALLWLCSAHFARATVGRISQQ
jgi:hypothetical protein